MRDAKRVKLQDNNKLDNSVEPFKTYTFDDVRKVLNDTKRNTDDVKGDVKKEKESCECQHGGGCVANVCLCPLGYAGVKCEITLDLKVRSFH